MGFSGMARAGRVALDKLSLPTKNPEDPDLLIAGQALTSSGTARNGDRNPDALFRFGTTRNCFYLRVTSILVLPATLISWEVGALPSCHTNALYCPSGTFGMK